MPMTLTDSRWLDDLRTLAPCPAALAWAEAPLGTMEGEAMMRHV